MSILPKLIYRFNATPIKIPARIFEDIDKIILNFIWKGKGIRIAKTVLKRRILWKETLYRHQDRVVWAQGQIQNR